MARAQEEEDSIGPNHINPLSSISSSCIVYPSPPVSAYMDEEPEEVVFLSAINIILL